MSGSPVNFAPTHDLDVIPLLPPNAEPQHGFEFQKTLQGNEREISIMFADIRAFTQFSEKKLPYDVVFVLNQYFRSMGTVIESEGGYVDKFIGDGIMALFGLSSDPADGCRRALASARGMGVAMEEMNEALEDDLDEPLRIGIGIHTGNAIVGEMGHGQVKSVTAIGDVVNTASRLEPLTKSFKCQLVVSDEVARLANVNLSSFPNENVTIRGREEKMKIYIIEGLATCRHAAARHQNHRTPIHSQRPILSQSSQIFQKTNLSRGSRDFRFR